MSPSACVPPGRLASQECSSSDAPALWLLLLMRLLLCPASAPGLFLLLLLLPASPLLAPSPSPPPATLPNAPFPNQRDSTFYASPQPLHTHGPHMSPAPVSQVPYFTATAATPPNPLTSEVGTNTVAGTSSRSRSSRVTSDSVRDARGSLSRYCFTLAQGRPVGRRGGGGGGAGWGEQ